MKAKFSALQINEVMSQSKNAACACPAQVCGAIVDLRELYDYQLNCLRETPTDRRMHEVIAQASERAHEIMENCLREILDIEGMSPAA